MKSWGANVASENKQRTLMKNQFSEIVVEGESVPLSFHMKHGDYELCPPPLVYVNSLKNMMFYLLDERERFELFMKIM